MDRASAAAFGLVAAFTVLHATWIARERSGFGLEQDEARILPLSYLLVEGWPQGPDELVRRWQGWPVIAPLLPTLASPVAALTDDPAWLVATVLPFLALLLTSAYLLGRGLGGRVSGLVALIAVGALPGVWWYARVFEQIVPAAALWLATLACIVRSDHLTSRGWRLGAAACLGLALLTRAMLIGFLPVLAVAYLLHALAQPRRERPSPIHVGEVAGLTTLIAAAWWWPQWRSATDYFREAGYAAYEAGFSLAAPRWRSEAEITELLAGGRNPLIAYGALGLLGLVAAAWPHRRRGAGGVLTYLRPLVASHHAFLAMVALGGHAVLVSSAQDFPGFGLVNLPIAVVLAASSLRHRPVRWALIPVALVLAGPTAQVMDAGSGWMPMVAYGYDADGLRPGDRAWPDFAWSSAERARDLASRAGRRPRLGVATNRVLYSGPVITIAALQHGLVLPLTDLNPGGLRERLTTGDLHDVNVALTAEPGALQPSTPLDVDEIEMALRRSGFRIVERTVMPDGETQRTWWRERGPEEAPRP